jgi:hypothetical protein
MSSAVTSDPHNGTGRPSHAGDHRDVVAQRIALIAHDNRKDELLDWARYNRGTLSGHELYATGTTGGRLATELHLPVIMFLSGPLGGDQQVGAAIAEGQPMEGRDVTSGMVTG